MVFVFQFLVLSRSYRSIPDLIHLMFLFQEHLQAGLLVLLRGALQGTRRCLAKGPEMVKVLVEGVLKWVLKMAQERPLEEFGSGPAKNCFAKVAVHEEDKKKMK